MCNGGSGLCWEATGDPEQEGFSTLMQRRGKMSSGREALAWRIG